MKKMKKLLPGRTYMIVFGKKAMCQEGFCRPLDENDSSILWETERGMYGGIKLINKKTKEKLQIWKCGWCGILGEQSLTNTWNLQEKNRMISEEFFFSTDPYSETGWLFSKIFGYPCYLTGGFRATTLSCQAGEFILYEVMHMDETNINR